MALTVREINNAGDALHAPDGSTLSGKEIQFLLVNAQGEACDAWDVFTNERILPIKKKVLTSTGEGVGALPIGEFEVSLWPNDRGSEPTFYKCSIKGQPEADFTAALASGAGAIRWIDFMAQGIPLSTVEVTALQTKADINNPSHTGKMEFNSHITMPYVSSVESTAVELNVRPVSVDSSTEAALLVNYLLDAPTDTLTTFNAQYLDIQTEVTDTSNYRYVAGSHTAIRPHGTGDMLGMYGFWAGITPMGTGVTSKAYGYHVHLFDQSAGTVDQFYGVNVLCTSPGSGVVNTAYGLYIGTLEATTRYAIYSSDALAAMYLAGNLQVGVSATGVSATKTLAVGSGVAPTSSPADAVQLYSADIGAVAGKAGLHIRSEDGSIVTIGDAVTAPTFKGTTIPIYANNAAALAGGLTAGAFYRTGADPDPLMIVH